MWEKNLRTNRKVIGKTRVHIWVLSSSILLTCKTFWQITFLRAHFPNYFNGFGISVKFCVFLIYCTYSTCAKKEIKSFLEVSSLHDKDLIHVSYFRWTGAGKNYVSRFIAESIFKERLFCTKKWDGWLINCMELNILWSLQLIGYKVC